MKKEKSNLTNHDLTIRSTEGLVVNQEPGEEEEKMVVKGYAVKFNSPTTIGGGLKEQFLPGAFKKWLDEGNEVFALNNHNKHDVLGRRSVGNMRVWEDEIGLVFELELDPESPHHKDIFTSVKRGDVNGLSVGFSGVKDTFASNIRSISQVNLVEVSLTAFPAYKDTFVSVSGRSNITATNQDILFARINNAFTKLKIKEA